MARRGNSSPDHDWVRRSSACPDSREVREGRRCRAPDRDTRSSLPYDPPPSPPFPWPFSSRLAPLRGSSCASSRCSHSTPPLMLRRRPRRLVAANLPSLLCLHCRSAPLRCCPSPLHCRSGPLHCRSAPLRCRSVPLPRCPFALASARPPPAAGGTLAPLRPSLRSPSPTGLRGCPSACMLLSRPR